MNKLKVIYSSNTPIACHIVKGRLESEEIECFIYDENIIWVDPFKAVAIGGVKLKVFSEKYEQATSILQLLEHNKLQDADGEYELSTTFKEDFQTQTKILYTKSEIRKNSALLRNPNNSSFQSLSNELLTNIINEETEFLRLKNLRFNFTFQQFIYELFDFDRSVFDYLRLRPVQYYLEKELVEYHDSSSEINNETVCPYCGSENINYGNAIDFKWDFLYLLFSFIFFVPFPLIRKKFHCFECKNDFKLN